MQMSNSFGWKWVIRAVTTKKPGGRNGNPLQYPRLENLMGRRAWLAAVDGVIKSQTQLSIHALMQQTKQIKKVDDIVFWGIAYTYDLLVVGQKGNRWWS